MKVDRASTLQRAEIHKSRENNQSKPMMMQRRPARGATTRTNRVRLRKNSCGWKTRRLPTKSSRGPNDTRTNPAAKSDAFGKVFTRLNSTAQAVVTAKRLNNEN
jgi:hypothetical protein